MPIGVCVSYLSASRITGLSRITIFRVAGSPPPKRKTPRISEALRQTWIVLLRFTTQNQTSQSKTQQGKGCRLGD